MACGVTIGSVSATAQVLALESPKFHMPQVWPNIKKKKKDRKMLYCISEALGKMSIPEELSLYFMIL